MKRVQLVFVTMLAWLDTVMISLAFYLGYRLRLLTNHRNIGPFRDYLPLMLVYVLSMLVVFFFHRLYRRRRAPSPLDELVALFRATVVGVLIAIAFISLLFKNSLDYHRLMMFYAWVLTLLLVWLGRVVHAQVQWWLQTRGAGQENVLIVGTGEVGRMILQKILGSSHLGYHVVGLVDVNSGPQSVLGVPVLGKTADLPALIDQHRVDEVIIALPEASHQEIVGIISLCEREKVGIRVFPDVFQIMASEVSISDLGGLPLLTIRDVALRGWKLTLKRGMDIVGAAIGLILFSPLMLLTALLIKLESPGPVFYVQERMGLDAKPFPMLKFRSMRQDAEASGPGWTTSDDPRRTRLGAIIRRLSIDELPQLINVLLGDMSLVGPRPERPVYVEQFRQRIPRYMDRHREKAGLTGWAQVNGLRGDTSIAERTKYDLWYIENWSLALDVKIIVRTIFRIF
ncbi:MAG TPA: undecaprenyl-phosphate glucose phosphotransferase, partial [Anaerolineae bacterium]|nr:undecaprenyl-phosphate glucose phosphotransferase [Anaerolineae bacterium]